jgi:hypothetical protein
MRRPATCILVFLAVLTLSCSTDQTTGETLREWRRGVWLLADGNYAVYTDSHYFVVSASGDSARANVYCGSSQIAFTDLGMARRQTLRVRKFPGGELKLSKTLEAFADGAEVPLQLDMTQFESGTCNIHEGIIYDSVTEITDQYILLATCNGDRERILADGRSVYMPAGGGEFWAHRIESW